MDTAAFIAFARAHADPARAAEMAAYMRGKFVFLGLPRPKLAKVAAPYLAEARTWEAPHVLEAMDCLYAAGEREFVYVAADLLKRRYRCLSPDAVTQVLPYVDRAAWWDSVDALRGSLSLWVAAHPDNLADITDHLLGGSMWQRRVAITLQLQWKAATNTDVLARCLEATAGDDEFFIQKAMGWALRDYSKTDPAWVAAFLAGHTLSALAVREASKYLHG